MSKPWNWTKHADEGTHASASSNRRSNLPTHRSNAYAPLGTTYQQMDQIFNEMFRNFNNFSLFPAFKNTSLLNLSTPSFYPSVDISSTDKEYTITVETPGINESDINIELERDGQLHIYGEKKQENEANEKNFHRIERSYGSFSRVLTLPDDADHENIQANFNNGLLTISVPREESSASQSRNIPIQTGQNSRNQRSSQGQHQTDNQGDKTRATHPANDRQKESASTFAKGA